MSADHAGTADERLCYMANQIARNFAALGEDAAVDATAEHIALYWDPRMKAAIVNCPPELLDPVARRVVGNLRRNDL